MADIEFSNPEEAFEPNNNALFEEVNDVNPDVDQIPGEDANVDENNDVNNNNNNGEDYVEPSYDNQDEGNENENANQAESDKKEINDIMENIFGGSDDEDSVGKQDKPSAAHSDLDDDELERENNKKMEKIKQKKNKKRKKSDEDDEGSDKKKRKKRKKERQIEEEGQDQDEGGVRPSGGDMQQQDDFELKFKEVLEKSKKKRYKPPGEQEIDETVDKVLDMMEEALEDDMNAIANKQPALKRLAILPTILEQLARIPLHDKFLEKGVCEHIQTWLTPLPDNTLPNLKIREGLLRVLLKYNGISAPHLSESGLGRAVMVLSRRPDETKENRKMAATLVTKWARPIFGLDEKPNAADMIPQQNFAPAPRAVPKKNARASHEELEAERTSISAPRAAIPELLAKKGHGYVRARAAVPEKARMDYTMKPASKLDDSMPIKKSTGARVKSNRLEKLIKGKEVGGGGGRSNSMNITKGSLE
jgi:transcription factor SPN1